MKLLIIGHSGHGKTAVAKVLREVHGITSISSSRFAINTFLFEAFKDRYATPDELYANRGKHRPEMFNLISAYNVPWERMATEITALYGAYDGMRNWNEFFASRHLFDAVLWVDRSDHVDPEPLSSFDIPLDNDMYVIDNNGSLDDLPAEVDRVMKQIEAVRNAA